MYAYAWEQEQGRRYKVMYFYLSVFQPLGFFVIGHLFFKAA